MSKSTVRSLSRWPPPIPPEFFEYGYVRDVALAHTLFEEDFPHKCLRCACSIDAADRRSLGRAEPVESEGVSPLPGPSRHPLQRAMLRYLDQLDSAVESKRQVAARKLLYIALGAWDRGCWRGA